MIGSGLKKLAKENGMQVSNGVAYGDLKGYASTLSEGSGWKMICIATRFPDVQSRDGLRNALMEHNITKQYRVREIVYHSDSIEIIFNDTYDTMKKIYGFIDLYYPLLKEYGATGSDICTGCGFALGTDAKWKLLNGAIAYPLHESCAQKLADEIAQEKEEMKQEDTGSYALGAIGALLGAFAGSLLWAVIFYVGYIASVVGFVICWLADKGYNLFKGKNGKAKVAILIVAVIFGVVAGTFIGEAAYLAADISSGALYDFTYADIPAILMYYLAIDPIYFIKSIGMGLLFAGLGVYSIIQKTNKEVSGAKITDLN